MKLEDPILIKRILEAAIMASEKPLNKRAINELFDDLEKPDDALINQALENLAEDCEKRGYELVQVASGFRFQVKQELSKWVGKLWKEKAPRYSRALLETLSLIAYRQPITRGEIEDIRGVAVSSQIIRTLLEREWIKAVGHKDVPGRPAIYATTKIFLDYFNLKNLDQLPPLAEIRDISAISEDFNIEIPPEMQQPAEGEAAELDEEGSNSALLEEAAIGSDIDESLESEALDAEALDDEPAGDLEYLGDSDTVSESEDNQEQEVDHIGAARNSEMHAGSHSDDENPLNC